MGSRVQPQRKKLWWRDLMKIHTVTIKDTQFNIPMCSAVDQRDILLSLGKYGLEGLLSGFLLSPEEDSGKERLGAVFLAVLLNKMPNNVTTAMCDKLLKGVMIHDESHPQKADLDFFKGRMEDYVELVKEALFFNFEGFFPSLDRLSQSLTGSKSRVPVETSEN